MSVVKFLLLAVSVFAGALGMNWLLNGDGEPVKSPVTALAVSGGVLIGKMYRKRYVSPKLLGLY